MLFERGGRDPNEREEKAMLSVARMMLAGANSGEGEPEARRAKELVTAGRLLLEAAAALLHESRRMDEVVQARKASLAPDPLPSN